uniref:Damage-inducible protein DinB n=1 Tax=Acidobacterium capsulatum TaxID=33075 RepID=A0A7V5CUJ1_9BACT
MSLAASFLPEFDHEFANTRRMLELVPNDHLSWKPHEKSMDLGRLAWHVADFPSWCNDLMSKPGLSMTAEDGAEYAEERTGKKREDVLARFDKDLPEAREALAATSDEEMARNWKMEWMGQTVIDMPRIAVYRSMVMNHMMHHRAQLGVYLRLLNIPIPGLYGPSADEMPS